MPHDIRNGQPVLSNQVGDDTHKRTHRATSHRLARIDGDTDADRVFVVPYDVRPLSVHWPTKPHLAALFDHEVIADVRPAAIVDVMPSHALKVGSRRSVVHDDAPNLSHQV